MDKIIESIKENPSKYIKYVKKKDLARLLEHLSDAYYNTNKILVSDEIFDFLKDHLDKIDPKHKFLHTIGAPVHAKKNKVKLPFNMPSLDKIKPSTNELEKWLLKYNGPYSLSDKLDGASALLYKYENDIKLYTRGNGIIAYDISYLIKHLFTDKIIKNIPDNYAIRGELIISKKNFDVLQKKMKLEHVRNAISGLIISKHYSKNIVKVAEFVAYSIVNPPYKHNIQISKLNKIGITTVYQKTCKVISNKSLSELLVKRREESTYGIDGIVVVDCSNNYKILSNDKPNHAFAFKKILTDQIAETTVLEVLWEPSMDGYLKPRVHVEELKLCGAKINYATAFNAKYVKDNKLGPGAVIKLIRSGDVIPHIEEILKPAKEPSMPNYEYTWNKTKVDIIVTNKNDLKMVKVKRMMHFFSTIKVKHIAKGILTLLVNNKLDTIEKIITSKSKHFSNIDGLGDLQFNKIKEQIFNSLDTVDLPTFLAASHCFGRGFAIKKHKLILKKYPNILNSKWTKKDMIKNIVLIKGFDTKTATQYSENFNEFQIFFNTINKVHDISRLKKVVAKKKTSKISDKKIVFTGFRDKSLENTVESLGGSVSSSVSKNTLMIVTPDIDGKSAKLEKARKLNIKIISRDDFIKFLKKL